MTKLIEVKDDGQIVMNFLASDLLRIIEGIGVTFIEPAIMTGQRFNVEKMAAFFRAEVIRLYVGELEVLRPIFAGAGTPEEVAKVFDEQADALRAELGRFYDANFRKPGPTHINEMIGKMNRVLEKAAVDSRSLGMQELFEPISRGERVSVWDTELETHFDGFFAQPIAERREIVKNMRDEEDEII